MLRSAPERKLKLVSLTPLAPTSGTVGVGWGIGGGGWVGVQQLRKHSLLTRRSRSVKEGDGARWTRAFTSSVLQWLSGQLRYFQRSAGGRSGRGRERRGGGQSMVECVRAPARSIVPASAPAGVWVGAVRVRVRANPNLIVCSVFTTTPRHTDSFLSRERLFSAGCFVLRRRWDETRDSQTQLTTSTIGRQHKCLPFVSHLGR